MKNTNTLTFTFGNPAYKTHRTVDFETIFEINVGTCEYRIGLTNCYMEWNTVGFVKTEFFYMLPTDSIIFEKVRYEFDDMPKLIMLLENRKTLEIIEALE